MTRYIVQTAHSRYELEENEQGWHVRIQGRSFPVHGAIDSEGNFLPASQIDSYTDFAHRRLRYGRISGENVEWGRTSEIAEIIPECDVAKPETGLAARL